MHTTHTTHTHTHTHTHTSYLIEYVWVARVEEVGHPFLYAAYYLGPHRVDQEIVAWHHVSFVTEE